MILDDIKDQQTIAELVKKHFYLSDDETKLFTLLMKFRQIKQKELESQLNNFFPEKNWNLTNIRNQLDSLKNKELVHEDYNKNFDLINLEGILHIVNEDLRNGFDFIENNKGDIIAEHEKLIDLDSKDFICKFRDIKEFLRDIKYLNPTKSIMVIGDKKIFEYLSNNIFSSPYYKNRLTYRKEKMNLTIILAKNEDKEMNHCYLLFNQLIYEKNSELGLRIDNFDLFKLYLKIFKIEGK